MSPAQFETMDLAARDRAAAIAAMGYRLAAAGPRMRRRLHRPAAAGADWWGEPDRSPSAAAPVASEDSPDADLDGEEQDEAIEPAPIPWARVAVLARRAVLLAGAACCGFGVVYAGMTLNLGRRPAAQARAAAAAEAPAVAVASAAPGSVMPSPQASSATAQRVVAAVPAPESAATVPAARAAVLTARPETDRPAVQMKLPPTRVLLAQARVAPARVMPARKLVSARVVLAATAHAERPGWRLARVRPEHRIAVARAELPRWLTDAPAQDAAPRPVVMSPPPGVLHVPVAAVAAPQKVEPAPAPEAAPRQAPEMVASVLPRIPERPPELAEESGYAREAVAPPPQYAPPAYGWGGYGYPAYGGYPPE